MEEEITQKEETPEELRNQLKEAVEGRDRFEGLYKDAQRKESKLAEREHKLAYGDQRWDSIQKKIDAQEETTALILDNLDELRGEPAEAKKTSRVDKLRAQRLEELEKAKPQYDSEEQKLLDQAYGIMQAQGWDESSAAYKKTQKATSGREIIEILKSEVKAENARIAKEQAEILYQQKLKEEGAAAGGAIGPSAAGQSTYTPKQIGALSYDEWVEKGRPNATRE